MKVWLKGEAGIYVPIEDATISDYTVSGSSNLKMIKITGKIAKTKQIFKEETGHFNMVPEEVTEYEDFEIIVDPSEVIRIVE